MELTKEQLLRYSRQITIKEFTEEGQKKLLASKVLVIGAGGLGSPVLMYLAAAGIGTIGIMDSDAVDISNLQRQIIHTDSSVGKDKTESAKSAILALNPEVLVNIYNEFADSCNLEKIIEEYDIVLDCTDNFEAKFLISDACVNVQKPMVHAAVAHFQGQLMTYVPGLGPCYRCVFEEPPVPGAVKTPKEVGVLGAMVGVIGSLQALECIKYLSGTGELLTGFMLCVDGLTMSIKKMRLPPVNPECSACHRHL